MDEAERQPGLLPARTPLTALPAASQPMGRAGGLCGLPALASALAGPVSSKGVPELPGLSQGVRGVPKGLQAPFCGGGYGAVQAGMRRPVYLCASFPLAAFYPASFLTPHLSPDGAAAAGGPRAAPGS